MSKNKLIIRNTEDNEVEIDFFAKLSKEKFELLFEEAKNSKGSTLPGLLRSLVIGQTKSEMSDKRTVKKGINMSREEKSRMPSRIKETFFKE